MTNIQGQVANIRDIMDQPGFLKRARNELEAGGPSFPKTDKRHSNSDLSLLEEHRCYVARLQALFTCKSGQKVTLEGHCWTDGISNADERHLKDFIDEAWAQNRGDCDRLLKDYREALRERLRGGSCSSKHSLRVANHMNGKPGGNGEENAPRVPVTHHVSPLNAKIDGRSRVDGRNSPQPFHIDVNEIGSGAINDLNIQGNENRIAVSGQINTVQIAGDRNTINVQSSHPRPIPRVRGNLHLGAQGLETREIPQDSSMLNASRLFEASTLNNTQPEALLLANNRQGWNR